MCDNELFEKVEKGTDICISSTDGCPKCPYAPFHPGSCSYYRSVDTLALIRSQQARIKVFEAAQERMAELAAAKTARVMSLEELDAIYQTKEWHTWPFNTPPWLWMTVNPDVRQTRGFWICWRDIMDSLESSSPFYVRENYGKAWKIWTAKPTDEQMEAVQWVK